MIPFKCVLIINYSCFLYQNDSAPCPRICYPSVEHKEGDVINEKDCVLLRSGPKDTDLPYVAKVSTFWENPEDGKMTLLSARVIFFISHFKSVVVQISYLQFASDAKRNHTTPLCETVSVVFRPQKHILWVP